MVNDTSEYAIWVSKISKAKKNALDYSHCNKEIWAKLQAVRDEWRVHLTSLPGC